MHSEEDPDETGYDPSSEVEAEYEASDSSSAVIAGGREDFTQTVELIDRFNNGEREALDRLIRRYFQRVHVIVRARLPRAYQSLFDIEDVVQRTFAQAVKNLDSFEHRSEGSFMRWITAIAINECNSVHDYLTAQKRGGGLNRHLESLVLRRNSDDGSIGFDPAGSADLPADVAAQRELVDQVVECLRELKERHREVIIQRDYNRMSWREVAEAMDLPSEGAASMLHTRARIALGRCLRKRGATG